MAFIRRVRTASGATAVQIAEYLRGRQRIVEHVGSAHTEAELGMLLERARQLLDNPALRGWWGTEFVSLKTRGPVALLG